MGLPPRSAGAHPRERRRAPIGVSNNGWRLLVRTAPWRWVRVALAALLATAIVIAAGLLAARGAGLAPVLGCAVLAATAAAGVVLAAIGWMQLRRQHGELAAQAASLARHARTDHLTGLGNAHAFREAVATFHDRPLGLLLIDVDGMHWANVVYGHQAGDEMLLGVARVLGTVCAAGDVAVRLGEDKFVLLLPGAGAARTTTVAEDVRVAVHGVAVSAGQLRLSVGCAWSPGGEDVEATMARADDALFAAKAGGGDRVAAQGDPGKGRRQLRAAVDAVLSDGRGVYSVYQPIVDVGDRRVFGWEALSRPQEWPPDADVETMFLTAHRMGRGRDLDWRCRRNALWEASRLHGSLFVNVSVAALVDPVHDVDQMLLLCEWAHRPPETVVLEMTERDAMPELRRLREVVARYRECGFRFALDDLGQGQTSLELVLAAQPEFLKLARPLLQGARRDRGARAAAAALVRFAHDTGSTVVAEGVEDDTDGELCSAMGIDLAQGWLFGRPQPAERIAPLTPTAA